MTRVQWLEVKPGDVVIDTRRALKARAALIEHHVVERKER